jgi:hypothetical protein
MLKKLRYALRGYQSLLLIFEDPLKALLSVERKMEMKIRVQREEESRESRVELKSC